MPVIYVLLSHFDSQLPIIQIIQYPIFFEVIIAAILYLFAIFLISYFIGYKRNFKYEWKKIESYGVKLHSITFSKQDMLVDITIENNNFKKVIPYTFCSNIRTKKNYIIFFLENAPVLFCPKIYFTEEQWCILNNWIA